MSFPDAEPIHPTRQLEFQIHSSPLPERLPGQRGSSNLSLCVPLHLQIINFIFSIFQTSWCRNTFPAGFRTPAFICGHRNWRIYCWGCSGRRSMFLRLCLQTSPWPWGLWPPPLLMHLKCLLDSPPEALLSLLHYLILLNRMTSWLSPVRNRLRPVPQGFSPFPPIGCSMECI